MTGFRRKIEERLAAKARARWAPVVVEPALTEFVGAAVRLYWRGVAIPAIVVPLLLVLLALGPRVPPGIGGTSLLVVGLVMSLRLPGPYRSLKYAAADGFGIARQDARKLDLAGPDTLVASAKRIREQGGRTTAG